MKHKINLIYFVGMTVALVALFSFTTSPVLFLKQPKSTLKDSIQKAAIQDSLKRVPKLILYKKNAHASYYADKFNNRRTASGKRFDNSKYTAAHRKFPFGTKLKITNEANGKSVVVEVTDRGPFSRGRDIDLTKRAFKEIAGSNYGGSIKVTIEEIK